MSANGNGQLLSTPCDDTLSVSSVSAGMPKSTASSIARMQSSFHLEPLTTRMKMLETALESASITDLGTELHQENDAVSFIPVESGPAISSRVDSGFTEDVDNEKREVDNEKREVDNEKREVVNEKMVFIPQQCSDDSENGAVVPSHTSYVQMAMPSARVHQKEHAQPKPKANTASDTGDLEVTFVLSSDQYLYTWTKADLKVYLPDTYSHKDSKYIDIKVCDVNSFIFPYGTKPVSGVFNVSTDLRKEAVLKLEHCFRGNQRDLAFAYCRCPHPPFEFKIASRQEYECSFTHSHGTIRTKLFPYWVIVRYYNRWIADLSDNHDSEDQQSGKRNPGNEAPCDGGGDKAKNNSQTPSGQSEQPPSHGQPLSQSLYPSRKRQHCEDGEEGGESGGNGSASPPEAMSWNCDNEEISIIPFYQIVSTHIKVNIVVTKKLCVNHEELKRYYDPLIWSSEQPTFGVQFNDHTVRVVCVKVGGEWESIGNHWQWKYGSPPVVDYFGQSAPTPNNISILINRTTNQRFRLEERIASSWKKIGNTLGLRPEALLAIEKDVIHYQSDEDRLREVLRSWFENASQLPHPRYYPLSWEGLFNLLKDSDREEDAREFFRFLDAMVKNNSSSS